jgi:hypothetical protein
VPANMSSIQRRIPGNSLVALFASVVVLGLTAGLVIAGRGHAAVSQNMSAFVHEDDSIGLKFADGSAVGGQTAVPLVIPPGTYSISVLDDATEHNFHLSGPGVDQSTDIGGVSTPTWSVTLQPGQSYRFQCDNHPDFMWGTFQTSGTAAGGGGTSTGGGGTTSSGGGGTTSNGGGGTTSNGGGLSTGIKTAGTLAATITSGGGVTFTFKGKTVTALKTGTYKISVLDGSKKTGFAVQKPTHATVTITSASFVGKHTVNLKLTTGKWTFITPSGKHVFTVS